MEQCCCCTFTKNIWPSLAHMQHLWYVGQRKKKPWWRIPAVCAESVRVSKVFEVLTFFLNGQCQAVHRSSTPRAPRSPTASRPDRVPRDSKCPDVVQPSDRHFTRHARGDTVHVAQVLLNSGRMGGRIPLACPFRHMVSKNVHMNPHTILSQQGGREEIQLAACCTFAVNTEFRLCSCSLIISLGPMPVHTRSADQQMGITFIARNLRTLGFYPNLRTARGHS